MPNGSEWDDDTDIRKLKKLDLLEISVVAIPMLAPAGITDVKQVNPRTLEKALKHAGLSGNDAVTAVAIVKKHLARDAAGDAAATADRDDPKVLNSLVEALRSARAGLLT